MKIKKIIHSVINFFYFIQNSVKHYNKVELFQLEKELKEKLNKLNQLASGEQFLRNKKVNELNNSIQNLLKLDRSFFWKTLASNESTLCLAKLNNFAENPNQFQSQANEIFIKLETTKYKDLFDNIEKLPLTASQRKACVINEENNLVLAGAGSGKTSVMVGRCAYLIESKLALAEEILVLAYNSDAASELTKRINEKIPNSNIKVSTFHGLGSELIRMATGSRGQISDLVEKEYLKKFITESITVELESNISLRIELFESLLPDQLDKIKSLKN